MYFVATSEDQIYHLAKTILILFDKIGNHNRHTPTYSNLAMYKNVSFFPCFFYEIKSLIKKSMELIILVIFSRNVKVVRDVLFGVIEKATSGN